MRAIVYTRTGDSDVLELVDRPMPEPGPGEVLIRVAVSGVNPTDWKARLGDGTGAPPPAGFQVPDQDGAGVIEAVGNGVDPVLVGERVWIWEAAFRRPWGTAAEYTVVPARQTVLLGPTAPYQLGASLGIPFLTAHRTLTLGESMPDRLNPGALTGRTVLVQGGAGAVGNAAIQLARWADATVIATVSSPAKAQLAAAAGASHVIDYRRQDVAVEVRKIVPHGVDAIVEVSPTANTTAVVPRVWDRRPFEKRFGGVVRRPGSGHVGWALTASGGRPVTDRGSPAVVLTRRSTRRCSACTGASRCTPTTAWT